MTTPDKENPNLIKVEVSHTEAMTADRVDLFVTIKGTSLITGRAALTKAREVGQLVVDLKTCGVEETDIHLEGVYAEVASGVITKSSRAVYNLKIRCANLDNLADVLGAITAQKNTSLDSMQWGYPDASALKEQWLTACIQAANRKAQLIAAALNVRLKGVFSFHEVVSDPEELRQSVQAEDAAFALGRTRSSIAKDDLQMEVSHVKTLALHITIEYHISEFMDEGAA